MWVMVNWARLSYLNYPQWNIGIFPYFILKWTGFLYKTSLIYS